MYENAIAIILAIGRAMMKPESSGFFPDSQLANAITRAANNTFDKKTMTLL
jgi:hypothetical protein